MTFHVDCSGDVFPISFPQMLSLLDGDWVSFFGIVRLICPSTLVSELQYPEYNRMYLRTLSLYLIVQCQKKLCVDTRCMHDTLKLIRFVHNDVYPAIECCFLDRLFLKLTYRSFKMYIDNGTSAV